MDLSATLDGHPLILTECAVSERLRRMENVTLHHQLFNTPLIYDDYGRERMTAIYHQYRTIAQNAKIPQILCAPTWRLNQERLQTAGYDENLLNDAVVYMQDLQKSWQDDSSPLFIAGLLGSKNDCYTPSLGLAENVSESFHLWQLEKLAFHNIDCLIAQTIPSVSEAIGIARAAARTNLRLLLSFVIDRFGRILDGTDLDTAIQQIDDATTIPPIGYLVNCVYPTFLIADKQPQRLFDRLQGIQANSSSKDHTELDGSDVLHKDDIHHWGDEMIRLNTLYGMKILGGCCGTDHTYLQYIVDHLD